MPPDPPTVYCPKDKEKVPIWYCLGSLTQGREPCSYLVGAPVHSGESAEVECLWKKCTDRPLYKILNPRHIVDGKPYKSCSAGEVPETCKEDTSNNSETFWEALLINPPIFREGHK